MIDSFFRFPHTPHLAWLGEGAPRDDKVLSPSEAEEMLAGDVIVEEKLDGANLGISLDETGRLRAQNRGQYLAMPSSGQFSRLPGWLDTHRGSLLGLMQPNWIVFGEWCAARHSLAYDRLPDWWLIFDVYVQDGAFYLPVDLRNGLANRAGLAVVAEVFRGHATVASLKKLLTDQPSGYRSGPLEGVVVRREQPGMPTVRAKLVRPDFLQVIGVHWRQRHIEWNRLQVPELGETPHGRKARDDIRDSS